MRSLYVPGFSLLELLLVVALFGIITAFISPAARSSYVANNARLATAATVDALRRAQSFAMAGRAHDTWGVHLTSTTITVFQGTTFVSRTTSSDEITDFPGSVTLSGTTDFVFSGLLGKSTTIGTTTLATDNGTTTTVSVNNQGMIE